jgi:hypothetical protein
MELRHLRYFIAVAEEGHMTRAAATVGMEQPPLSVQIKALEKEVGTPLFKRHSRGVALTAGGEVLLEAAREILANLERSKERARHVGEGTQGHVTIGIAASVAAHRFAADVVREFRRLYPGVGLDVRSLIGWLGYDCVNPDAAYTAANMSSTARRNICMIGLDFSAFVRFKMRLRREPHGLRFRLSHRHPPSIAERNTPCTLSLSPPIMTEPSRITVPYRMKRAKRSRHSNAPEES